MLHVRTLGELRLEGPDGSPVAIRRKPLALLSYVARLAPRAVTRLELATLFWGERGEDRARQSLRQTLLELKQSAGDHVEIDNEAVRLSSGSRVELDIMAFERDVASGNVRSAVDRWTGEFYAGAEDVGGEGFRRWIENERATLHRQLSGAFQRLIGDAEIRGDWAEACSWAERWASALQFDEAAHLRLIEALRMSGRATEAARVHGAFATRLRTALDVEPSPEFMRLGGGLADGLRAEMARQGKGSVAVHAPQFVGRGLTFSELMSAWASASDGTPIVVLLEGEAGSGVTRVSDELVAQVQAKGVVLRARGKGETTPYATASALLEGIRDAEGSAGAAPEALAEVARLVPALAHQFRHLPAPRGDDTSLREGIAQTLAAISEEQPVLLVLDDAHAADAASRHLLGALAGRLTGRVLFVATVDEAERSSDPGLDALRETRGLRRLWLHALGVPDVEAMLGSMVSLAPDDRHTLAGILHRESGGLPHDVCALVTSLVDDHLLTVDADGSWRISPALAGRPLPLPASVRDRTRARLGRLTPDAGAMAGALSVLGAPSTVLVVEEVAEVAPDAAETALAELVSNRIVREADGDPTHYEFTSPLVGRAVAALQSATKRRALHARAAEVLVTRDMAATAERSLLPYHLARADHLPAEPRGETTASTARRPIWARRSTMVVAAGVATAAIAFARFDLGGLRVRSAAGDASTGIPVVALGRIANYREAGAADLTKPLIDMLATNLARVSGMRVVSTARMYELVSQTRRESDSAAVIVGAARRAGATELVDGALYTLADGSMRLDLRRVELATGSTRKAHSVNGASLFELADSGTARLAGDFGAASPTGSVADVTTKSLAAYRLYEEGLRAFYENDRASAQQLFDAALGEDSTFAMAAYYAAMTRRDNFREIAPHFGRALRLVARASERERLIIEAQWALLTSSPALSELADSLTLRYPLEVEGHLFSGIALFKQARYPESIRALERAIAMDSATVARGRAQCSACDGLEYLIRAYRYTDDYVGAEREARRWLRLQPRSAQAWEQLHFVLGARGKTDSALQALRRRASLSAAAAAREPVVAAQLHIIGGNLDAAERLLDAFVATVGDSLRLADAIWYHIILYRNQGRMREAYEVARRYRRLVTQTRDSFPELWVAEAQVLLESGRHRQAAALYDTVTNWETRSRLTANPARARVWRLAQVATALAAAGDTASLPRLADTMRILGTRSGDARDQRIHHYVRALSLIARRQDDDVLGELARAASSPSEGYTRINLETARAALRRNRPRDAIAAVQPALRGLIEGAGYYVPRTDLHELAAQAWDAAGGRDSAIVHYEYVTRAWRKADPAFAARLASAQQRLDALRGRR